MRQITLTMQIHTMQILISEILCVGKIRSRPAPGVYQLYKITTTTKISAPGRLQKSDFRPPALLVYETHNEGRLGKNKSHHLSICGKNASIACRPTAPVRKKMRHVGQSKVIKSHFDLANPYHADFDISNSLCR